MYRRTRAKQSEARKGNERWSWKAFASPFNYRQLVAVADARVMSGAQLITGVHGGATINVSVNVAGAERAKE